MEEKRNIYATKALNQVPKLLSFMDRNEYSPTYGCFCRDYWHDKVIDTPSAHFQESVSVLALLYKYKFPNSIYFANHKIRDWCIGGMRFWRQIQHKDGSFDDFYPYERALGATVITLYAVLESYGLLRNEVSSKDSDQILSAAYKTAKWLTKNDEPSLLTNHQAQALLALYKASEIFNEDVFLKAAAKRLEKIKNAQSPEGWFVEYGGADLGYLTTTISFLAKYYKETKDERVLDMLKKAVSFVSYFIYPNNSYGGFIGSRNTMHFHPHGFEILAKDISLAGKIADAALKGINAGTLLSPEMETRYFPESQYEFLQAYLDFTPRFNEEIKLPYETKLFKKYFNDARIFIINEENYYAIVGVNKGGVLKIYSINPPKLIYSDAGLIGTLKGGEMISSQWLDNNYHVEVDRDEIEVSGNFHKYTPQLPSPTKQILFRLGLLTMFRSNWASYQLKKNLMKMLIIKNETVPIKFTREVKCSKKIQIQDTIEIQGKKRFDSLAIGDEFSLIFVAYSKHFQTQELSSESINLNDVVERLNRNRKVNIKRVINPIEGNIEVLTNDKNKG